MGLHFLRRKLLAPIKVAHNSFYVEPTALERTLTMNVFTHTAYALDEIGSTGGGTISFKVTGFWSHESITLYIRRNFSWDRATADGTWTAEISRSSGGRDKNEVECDLQATLNYAAALVAAAELGKAILARADGLERAYQCERARAKAEQAALAAAAEADPELGAAVAKQLVDERMAMARADRPNQLRALTRGMEQAGKTINFERTLRGGVVRVTIDNRPSSRAEAIKVLANSSNRTAR